MVAVSAATAVAGAVTCVHMCVCPGAVVTLALASVRQCALSLVARQSHRLDLSTASDLLVQLPHCVRLVLNRERVLPWLHLTLRLSFQSPNASPFFE